MSESALSKEKCRGKEIKAEVDTDYFSFEQFNAKSREMKFQDYSNIIVSGCSNSGKSTFAHRLIKHARDMFITPPSKVIYVYKHWQPLYDDLRLKVKGIDFLEKLPSEEELTNMVRGHNHSVLVADDKMADINNSNHAGDLFTRLSHHLGISTVLLPK